MEFRLIKENEDGSADYTLHLTSDETSDIVRTVIMKALLLAAQEGSNYDPSKSNVGDATSGGKDSVHGSGEQPSEPEQPSDGFKTSQVLG